ncbi:MAG TPA: hypothetical protein VFI86_01610 [Burkholderiales bacterium]|nr:hypothetical protein [Burkholderiales bacterium]
MVAFICGAAIDVYVLGHVERMKGADTTFLIFCWLSPVPGLVGASAYVAGARIVGFVPRKLPSLLSGGSIAALFWLAGYASGPLPGAASIAIPWLIVLAGSFLAARAARACALRGSAPADS